MTGAPTSILCFRNGSIGNTLVAVPALRALRKSFPSASLAVVVDPVGYQLLEHCPWINRLIVYEKHGAHRGVRAHAQLIRELRALHPSHAVLFKRFFRNGLLARLSGAAVRAGFKTNERAPFLNLTVPYDESVPVVDLNLRLSERLGATPDGRDLELFLAPEDRDAAADLLHALRFADKTFVIAHYGGLTTPPDFMPLRRFLHVLRQIAGKTGRVLLIGHGAAEQAWADEISAQFPNARPMCGLPLRTTAALIERSRLFIGFNSGPAHIAAAVRVPEIIFFRPDARVAAEVRKWCPPSPLAHPLVPPASPDDDKAWAALIATVSKIAGPPVPVAIQRRT
ncbi:MAG TPA: glycosyltransferase family 9 protein [bacterium]